MRRTIILLLLATFCMLSNAQTFKTSTTLGVDFGSTYNYKIITPHIAYTYNITPKLSVGVRAEDAVTFQRDDNGNKIGDDRFALGGQVGYKAIQLCKFVNIQPRISVGHTINSSGNQDYLYYQAGVYLTCEDKVGYPEIGFGFRNNFYHHSLDKNKTVFFISYAFILP
ncbi:transporter [Prevotella sp.]